MLMLPAFVALVSMVALMFVTPGIMQVAMPFIAIAATVVSEEVHVTPSAAVSTLVVLLSNLPIAVNVTIGLELLIITTAVEGLTTMLISLG